MLCNQLHDTCHNPSTGAAFRNILSAFNYMVASTCLIADEWQPSADIKDCDTFDFIIIGAGSAGCVVANRLTEIDRWNVLLIEAGGIQPIESYIPHLQKELLNTTYDWQYRTVATGKTNSANMGEAIDWPRGKGLGGSSLINGMIYFEALTYDYQKWYDHGNPEWHPDILCKFSKKSQSLQDQKLLQNPYIRKKYGVNGPQIINTANNTQQQEELINKVLESYSEMGFKVQEDLRTANLLGSGISRATASNGKRASTASTYLNHIQSRKNFKLITNAFVIKLLINNCSEAYGVIVKYKNLEIKILASLEVILSAGVINSPQLLMLSGIGERKHLESKNIQCKVDLPGVGKNLQDHLNINLPVFGTEPGYEDMAKKFLDVALYSFNRTGYLAQPSFPHVLLFYARDRNATSPEFQIHLDLLPRNSTEAKQFFSIYKESISKSFGELTERYGTFVFHVNLLHPYSRGNISLNTNNPFDHPLIYANYFDDPRDLEITIEGIRMLESITDTDFFKKIKGFFGRFNWAKCKSYKINSDDYWRCLAPDIVTTIYHPVGTCAMGPDSRFDVVDSRLRVHLVKGLRVIDASIMPNITSCNTNGATITIAERGSDLIKEDYGIKEKLEFESCP